MENIVYIEDYYYLVTSFITHNMIYHTTNVENIFTKLDQIEFHNKMKELRDILFYVHLI